MNEESPNGLTYVPARHTYDDAGRHSVETQANGTGGAGVQWVKTTATAIAGPVFDNVIVNSAGTNGFRFENQAAGTTSEFIFMTNCAADGAFGADAFVELESLVQPPLVPPANSVAAPTLALSTRQKLAGAGASPT